jgi:hypothetical protein
MIYMNKYHSQQILKNPSRYVNEKWTILLLFFHPVINIFHNNFTLFLQSIAMSSRVVQGHSRGMNLEMMKSFSMM